MAEELLAMFDVPRHATCFTKAEMKLVRSVCDGELPDVDASMLKFYYGRQGVHLKTWREKFEGLRAKGYRFIKNDVILFRYETVLLLGKGAFGTAVKAIDHGTATKEFVAVKIISKCSTKHGAREKFIAMEWFRLERAGVKENEFVALARSCMSVDGRLAFVYKFAAGKTIDDDMTEREINAYKLPDCRLIIGNVVAGLQFMHSHGIVHSDLKCDNIMVQRDPQGKIQSAKIIDLGNAFMVTEIAEMRRYTTDLDYVLESRGNLELVGLNRLGVLCYRSPESVFRYLAKICEKVDIWAVGLIAIELLIGDRVFIRTHERFEAEAAFETLMFEWKCFLGDLVKHLPEHHAQKRRYRDPWYDTWVASEPTTSSAFSTRLNAKMRQFKSLKSFAKICLMYDSCARASAKQLLAHPFLKH